MPFLKGLIESCACMGSNVCMFVYGSSRGGWRVKVQMRCDLDVEWEREGDISCYRETESGCLGY